MITDRTTGENNRGPVSDISEVLNGVKSLDDNQETLRRTVAHLKDNQVDLAKYPLSMGPVLKFDTTNETFPDSPEATALLTRPYRKGFACPSADKV